MLTLTAVILAVLVLLPVSGIVSNHPPLSDPPGLVERIKTYLGNNVAETAPDSIYPELRPRRYALSAGQLFDAAMEACTALGWEPVIGERQHYTIRAVVTTRLWRFKDDVEIRVETGENRVPTSDGASANGVWLSVRSASRLGRGDLGANTRHVLDLMDALDRIIAEERR